MIKKKTNKVFMLLNGHISRSTIRHNPTGNRTGGQHERISQDNHQRRTQDGSHSIQDPGQQRLLQVQRPVPPGQPADDTGVWEVRALLPKVL